MLRNAVATLDALLSATGTTVPVESIVPHSPGHVEPGIVGGTLSQQLLQQPSESATAANTAGPSVQQRQTAAAAAATAAMKAAGRAVPSSLIGDPALDSLLGKERAKLAQIKSGGATVGNPSLHATPLPLDVDVYAAPAPPLRHPSSPPHGTILPPPPPLPPPSPVQSAVAAMDKQSHWQQFRRMYSLVAKESANSNPELATVRGGASIAMVLEQLGGNSLKGEPLMLCYDIFEALDRAWLQVRKTIPLQLPAVRVHSAA